jgi:tetratricopeptide (TPR) repeat protein
LGPDCWFDVREMTRLCSEAAGMAGDDPAGAIARYREAVALYAGDYLPGHPYESWAISARYYYRRLYMEGLMQLVELLRDAGEYAEIVRICERAFAIEPLLEAEDLHHRFMQALVEEGRTVDALAHYRFIAGLLDRELGVKPSRHLRDLNRLLKTDMEVASLDLDALDDRLGEGRVAEGALLCDRDMFRFLYRLEMRRGERSGGVICLALFGLSWRESRQPRGRALAVAMSALQEVLTSSLRKGDVIAQWNEEQCLVMLPGCSGEDAEDLCARIETSFSQRSGAGVGLVSQVQAFSLPR